MTAQIHGVHQNYQNDPYALVATRWRLRFFGGASRSLRGRRLGSIEQPGFGWTVAATEK